MFSLEFFLKTLPRGNRGQNGGRSPILGICFGLKLKICLGYFSETKVNERQVNKRKSEPAKNSKLQN